MLPAQCTGTRAGLFVSGLDNAAELPKVGRLKTQQAAAVRSAYQDRGRPPIGDLGNFPCLQRAILAGAYKKRSVSRECEDVALLIGRKKAHENLARFCIKQLTLAGDPRAGRWRDDDITLERADHP